MKKLLYLVPLMLIGLSFLPISAYRDRVDFLLSINPNAKVDDFFSAAKQLSPQHWKTLEYNTSFSSSPAGTSFDIDSFLSGEDSPIDKTESQVAIKPEPIYQGAEFKGFPFAAYFSKNNTTSNAQGSSSLNISGYSWLWVTVNALIVTASLVVAVLINRKKKLVTQAPQQAIPYPEVSPVVAPQVQPTTQVITGSQQEVLMPTQSPQQVTTPQINQTDAGITASDTSLNPPQG